MKKEKEQQAVKLRKQGQSIKQIAKELKVSPGSVSIWAKDVRLTQKQIHDLRVRGSGFGRPEAAKAWSEKNRKKRRKYQELGREDARQNNAEHAMACMLYWGEGAKRNNKNTVKITNGDSSLLKMFVSCLKNFFSVEEERIRLYIRYFPDNDLDVDEVEHHWKCELNLQKAKCHLSESNDPRSKKADIGKLPYGLCQVALGSTEIVQRIFGSIKEYANIPDKDQWLG